MSPIAIRSDWNKNEAQYQFSNVEEALHHIQEHTSYEIIGDGYVRPYGDLDCKEFKGTEAEFHRVDAELYSSIAKFFADNDKKVTITGSSAYPKMSLRWYVPDIYLESREHAKAFARDLYSRIELPSCMTADYSVYSSYKKMRTFYTSKPNENRPFYMLQGDIQDTLITHIPSYATKFEFELEKEEVADVKPVSVVESSYITQLCDCISLDTWTDYTSCMGLIFSLLSVGACSDIIHSYCSKAPNYSRKWVQDFIRSFNPDKSKYSLGTLKYHAMQGNIVAFRKIVVPDAIKRENSRKAFDEITQLTPTPLTQNNWNIEGGWIRPLPVHTTTALKSAMGTGKTREIIRLCSPSPFVPVTSSICILSPRITFTDHIIAEVDGFVNYQACKGTIDADKLVLSVQSAHRVERSYEMLILDEIETTLSSLTPNKTHGKNYMRNIEAFERLVRNAKRVICLDAFLSDRSIRMLTALRGDVHIYINPHQPYKKNCTLYTEPNSFFSALGHRLSKGKRMIGIWGGKEKGKNFHSLLQCKNVFYSADTDGTQKKEHLEDVNTHWAKYQCVGYTPAISVGINYTASTLFDQAFLYGTPWSCTARDYLQALHRARVLADNEVLAYIDMKPRPCTQDAGYDIQQKLWDEDTERRKQFIVKELDEQLEDYKLFPAWLRDVLCWNRNERVTNRLHFHACMTGYLQECGIAVDTIETQTKDIKKKSATTLISVTEVADIEYEQVEEYVRARGSLTEMQKYELEKYYLSQKVSVVDERIWEDWNKRRYIIERCFVLFNKTPTDLVVEKVVDLVPKDAERLAVLQGLGVDFKTAWTRDCDLSVDLELFGVRKRTEKDTPEQKARDFCKAVAEWGLDMKVERKKKQIDGVRDYVYSLTYSPTGIAGYVKKPLRASDIDWN